MLAGKRVIVTGSSGFIGRHLIRELEKRNANIIKLDLHNGFDLSIWENVRRIEKFDIAFHLAARTYVPDSYKNPLDFYNTNILTTLNMLELCRLYNAKIIFPSSYVYGEPQYLPIDEKHPLAGFNPYAQTKIICEKICEGYSRDYNVKVIILRPSNCYGKGQNINFLIPKIIQQAKTNKIQLNNPKPKRDFIYVTDLVDAFIKAALYSESNFEIFNIGLGKSYSVKEIVTFIINNITDEIQVEFLYSDRTIEVMDTVYDINKAKMKLNWVPKVGIKEGLKKIINSIKDQYI